MYSFREKTRAIADAFHSHGGLAPAALDARSLELPEFYRAR
jgi:hypothetical protein